LTKDSGFGPSHDDSNVFKFSTCRLLVLLN
jgi:hypothetical protein